MKKSWLVFAVFFLSGCAGTKATIGEFQGMSSDERTKYICENHAEVKRLSYIVDGHLGAVKKYEAIVEKEGDKEYESCSSSSDGSFSATYCVTQTASGLLRFHKGGYEEYSPLLIEKVTECKEDVQNLGAKEAYDYYQKVEGGFYWDLMGKMNPDIDE